jgi:transposase-like protein
MKPFKNLIQVTTYFADKDVCNQYLEKLRWDDGNIRCPHCSSTKRVYRMKHNYKCGECRKQFSVRKGSIFENSPIPLQKWFVAIWLITSHKKGISSLQLAEDISVTQKTAWFMLHRIRYALEMGSYDKPLENTVEVDETYIGGKNKNRHADKKVKNSQGRSTKDKIPVFGLVERNGEVRAMKVLSVSAKELQEKIAENVCNNVTIVSDEWLAYKGLDKTYNHLRVNHGQGIYVLGDAHTNTIEGFWSLLKRGYIGIYHYMSSKHLDKYVKEFEFRYNNRRETPVYKFDKMLSLCNQRLTYQQLIA